MTIQSICVYCGSSPGGSPEYMRAAGELGAELGRRGLRLVYGGSGVGLMGEVARAALAAGGKVTGVITEALAAHKMAFDGLDDLRVVPDMHARKAAMAELADGFVALPGGFGTYEEFFEVVTWLQLGIHTKPCGLLNAGGFYDGLLAFLDHAANEQFIFGPHRGLVLAQPSAAGLLDALAEWQPVQADKTKWARRLSGHAVHEE